MIASKFWSLGELHFICSCDESAEFSFSEAWDPELEMVVCPYCGEAYDVDPEDVPEYEDEPMTLDEYMHMKL